MIQQRSRIPALMMLLALMAFGLGMVFARRGSANVVQNSQLNALKAAVAKNPFNHRLYLALADAYVDNKDCDLAQVALFNAYALAPEAELSGGAASSFRSSWSNLRLGIALCFTTMWS